MIHRAPMTRKEMEKEDIEQRQGRSPKQIEGNYKILFWSLIGLISTLIVAFVCDLITNG